MKINAIVFLSFLLLSSCVVKSKYNLYSVKSIDNYSISKDVDLILIKNNFSEDLSNVSHFIDIDFKKIFTKISINPSLLEFNNNYFITSINEDVLNNLREETKSDYLILIQSLIKPSFSNYANPSIIVTTNKYHKREYHIILRLIDLNTKETIYLKESISTIKISNEYSTISPSEKEQLKRTYQLIFDDFKKQFNL